MSINLKIRFLHLFSADMRLLNGLLHKPFIIKNEVFSYMRENIFRKGIALLLTLCVLFGVTQIIITAENLATKGNYVFNHGDTSNVTLFGGKGHTVDSAEGATAFGEAVSVAANTVNGSGWVRIPAAVPSDFDFSATKGIAFYVKFPKDVSTTNISVRLINKTWSKYFEIGTDVELTLVDTERNKSKVKCALPFENMQGYEGYVFVPYDALTSRRPSSVSVSDLNAANWNVEISLYTQNPDRVNVPFLFDQVGYYSDVDEYVALSDSFLTDANYIFNSGDDAEVRIVGGTGHTAVTAENISMLGDALNIYPNKTEADGWVQIPADIQDKNFDFEATQGIAMYVKLPVGGDNTNFTVRLIKKDWSEYYSIGLNKLLTFVTLSGTKPNIISKTQYLPLENMQGFEGFVFIPYEALSDGSGPVDKNKLNRSDWAVEISLYYTQSSCIGLNYYFDEIGYYNDVKGYVNKALGDIIKGNEIINSGDVSSVICEGALTAEIAASATEYGGGILLSSTGAGSVSVPVKTGNSLVTGSTSGIAAYVKLPSVLSANLKVGLVRGKDGYYAETGADIVLMPSDGSYKSAKYSSESLAGYEGFVFIPYTSLSGGMSAKELENGEWSISLSGNFPQSVIIDEIGLWSNPKVYFSIAVKQPSANHIFNSGDASVIKLYSGRDVLIEQLENASWCSSAVNIAPMKTYGGGWAQIPATTPSGYDYNATKGIAMYVKMPQLMTESALSIRLINKAWTKWFTLAYNGEVTLIRNNGAEESVTGNLSSVIAGYEGFLFIPYTSMTEGSETSVDKSALNSTDWNVEIGYYAGSDSNIGQKYIFDEIGYYSDMRGYINTVKKKYSNDIANDGSRSGELTLKDGDSVKYSAVKSMYGGAYNITPSKLNSSGRVNIPFSARDGFSFVHTLGIAMYVNLPESAVKSGIEVGLVKNDRSERYSFADGKPITLISYDGSESQAAQSLPEALADFDGFVFIPYTSLVGKDGGTVEPAVINSTEWSLEVGYAAASEKCIADNYYFDEIGFYCDKDEYIKLAKQHFTGENYIFNIGDASGVTVTDGSDIKSETKYRSAAYGDAVLLSPPANGTGRVRIPASGNIEHSLTRGIAMYVEIPDSVAASGLTVSLSDGTGGKYYTLGNESYCVLKNSEGVKKFVSGDIRNALSGYNGFIFIPYGSMRDENGAKMDASQLSASGWGIEISFSAKGEAAQAQYIFDEMGYYSDIDGYLTLAADDLGKSAIENPDGPADPVAEMEKGNYIANHGDSINEVWQSGSILMERDSVISPYGTSIAMLPNETTPSVNTFGAYYINMPEGKVLENAKGIAFYMNFPEGGTQTQVQLLLQVDNEVFWVCEDNTECVVYDMKGNRTEETMWYPLADMQGFEGYVFVPFSSMHYGGAGGKTGVDVNLLAGKTVSFRFGHYRWNENELNLKYVVDEIGYYGDEKGYLNLVKSQKAKPERDESGNYIINNCDQENKVTVRDASQISIVEKEGVGDTKYSIALKANILKASQPFGCFKTDTAKKDFSESKGIAMYVNFPSDVTRTNSTVMIAANESLYYTLKDSPVYSIADMKGNVKTVTPEFALENLQGFEGYIFVPFDQFESKTGAKLTGAILNAMKFELRISQYRDNRSDINKEYIYDSIGCYSDINAYTELVKNNDDPVRPENGDYLYKTYDDIKNEYNIYDDIKIEKVDGVTGMGSAVSVTPTAVNSTAWFVSPFEKGGDDWKSSNGLAFYIEIPEGVRDSSSEIFLVNTDTDFWKVKSGATITLVSIYGEVMSSRSNGLPLQNLGGYKGWVFIPFNQFINGMGYSGELEDLIDNYSRLQFRTGYYKIYNTDVNVSYIYDSVGYYRTYSSYLNMMGYEFKEKPTDLKYYNKDTDANGFYMINNVKDSGAFISGTYGAENTPAADGRGSDITVNGEFMLNLNNFRRGDELLIGSSGIALYMKNISDLSDLVFRVGIVDDGNSSAVERYEFDSTVSEFYYSIGDRLYVVSASELKLPFNFEGYIYLPFDNFAPTSDSVPDNLIVDPDSVSSVSISSSGGAAFRIADISFYSTQDMLETAIGAPKSPFDFTLSVRGKRSEFVTVTKDQLRLYADFKFSELKSMISVSNPNYSVIFTDNNGTEINSDAVISGDFKLRVVCGNSVIKEFGVIRVTNIFKAPERTILKSAVKEVAGKEVKRNKVYTKRFDSSADDFAVDEFFTVKKSAAGVISFINGGLSVKQVVTVSRLLSAFNLFNGTSLRVVDASGKDLSDNDVVTNDCRLVASVNGLNILLYKVSDVPLGGGKSGSDQILPQPESGFPMWIIAVASAAVLVCGAVIVFIIFFKKKKAKKA